METVVLVCQSGDEAECEEKKVMKWIKYQFVPST